MRNWILTGLVSLLTATLSAQSQTFAADMANLREDVRLLQQRVGELSLSVEQLSRENSALQTKAGQSYATLEQLNKAVAEMNRATQAGLADQKHEVLAQVATQMEKLARQTQAAIDALAKNQATRPAVQTSFNENYSKEGVSYTVQTGDTLPAIAKKTGGKVADIVNANKISDPSHIKVGQTLFIPQGK